MLKKISAWLLNNQTTNQTIAKNTFWLFLGQILGRALRAVVVIYAARTLGAAGWGAFSYAIGLAAFLTIFSDIGINALITKEASRNPELKNQYLATAFFTKIGLLAILIAGVVILFPKLSSIPEATAIMPILIFVFAFDTLRDLGSSISRALQKMEVEALINIFTNFAITVFGLLFLWALPSSHSLALAYAIGSGLGFFAIVYALRGHFQNFFQNFRSDLVKPILSMAWPFGLMGLMGTIMLNTDIIMLGWMESVEKVGYYSAAQKPIQLLYILPTLLASSIFPIMAKLAKSDPGTVKELMEKYIAKVMLAAVPTAILGIIFANPIINLLFGAEYAAAIPTFRILMATILIVFPSTILGNAIFAYDQQRHFITFAVTAALGNVLFNLLLIPPFGIEGAAVATILSQLITNALIWIKMKRINHFRILPEVRAQLRNLTHTP